MLGSNPSTCKKGRRESHARRPGPMTTWHGTPPNTNSLLPEYLNNRIRQFLSYPSKAVNPPPPRRGGRGVGVTDDDWVEGGFMEIRIGPDLIQGELAEAVSQLLPSLNNIWVLCIGTDRVTGDSFGPLTGTFLKRLGFSNVLGTLHEPVHATNLNEYVQRLRDEFVIAIDAGLGLPSNVGKIVVKDNPMLAGRGVGKDYLPSVGNVSVMAIVNMSGLMDHMVLSHTRLSVVWDMAEYVSYELYAVLGGRNVSYSTN